MRYPKWGYLDSNPDQHPWLATNESMTEHTKMTDPLSPFEKGRFDHSAAKVPGYSREKHGKLPKQPRGLWSGCVELNRIKAQTSETSYPVLVAYKRKMFSLSHIQLVTWWSSRIIRTMQEKEKKEEWGRIRWKGGPHVEMRCDGHKPTSWDKCGRVAKIQEQP